MRPRAYLISCMVVCGCGATEPPAPVVQRSSTALTWAQDTKLVASDGSPGDGFGGPLGVDDAALIVGAPLDDDGATGAGSAYVFTRQGTLWLEQDKLTASDAAADDAFGYAVALSGDTALVGAFAADDAGTSSGSAYVFARSGTLWLEELELSPSDAGAGLGFGWAVDLEGDLAVIGAPGDENDAATGSGAAYLFARSGSSWVEQQRLAPLGAEQGDAIGSAVALEGTTLVVGAINDDDKGANSGAAYVFVQGGTSWTEQAKLVPSDGVARQRVGISVALSGDSVAVGTLPETSTVVEAAYVFTRTGTAWTEQARLVPETAAVNFGAQISVLGDTLAASSFGSAYLFSRDTTNWAQAAALGVNDSGFFGRSVALANQALVVGAPGTATSTDPGAAYVFAITPDPRACQLGSECLSGVCAGGVCCDTACAGACETCLASEGASADGVCTPLAQGSEAGCAPFVCNGTDGSCPTLCESDRDCADGRYCASDGSCQPSRANGAACDGRVDCQEPGCRVCASGDCADGVCCDRACTGQCEACAEAGSVGTCIAVSGAPRGVRQACSGEGPCAGSCDGSYRPSCVYPAAGNECAAPACDDGVALTHTCNGRGDCIERQTACHQYACKGSACAESCSSAAECADGFECREGTCQLPPSAECLDERTHRSASGVTTACTPYTCTLKGCRTACTRLSDCVTGYICDPETSRCVPEPPSSHGEAPSGCGCRLPAPPAGHGGWLALGLALMGLRRRRSSP